MPRLVLLCAAAAAAAAREANTVAAWGNVLAEDSAAAATAAASNITVAARRYVLAEDATTFQTEADNAYEATTVTLDPSKTALLMIDVWDDSASAPLFENENERTLPLLALARALGMLVVHAPSEAPEWPAIEARPRAAHE